MKFKNKFSEISLKDAKAINSAAETGDELLDPLPPLDFGRVAAQAAKTGYNFKKLGKLSVQDSMTNSRTKLVK